MVDRLEYIALSYISTHFQVLCGCFKTIVQLLESNWLPNILAGFNLCAQENGLMSTDGVCTTSTGPAGHEAK